MMNGLSLSWSGGSARVLETGAMLSDMVFRLDDGRRIEPLHKAPWLGEALSVDTPPLLTNLQGEWPCAPFGAPSNTPLNADWAGLNAEPETWPHGYGANHAWTLSKPSQDRVDAYISYPDGTPIASLKRSVSGRNGRNTIDMTLEVTARQNAKIPIGLHPVFKLPETPGAARLLVGDYSKVWVYPGDTGGDSLFKFSAPANTFNDLAWRGPEGWDPLSLPYPTASESIVLLSNSSGCVTLENMAEQYRCTLEWDANVLPSLMLWISNNGRSSAPWNGRHLALGVEPVCAPFDFGAKVATLHTPLSLAGIPTAISLSRHQPWRTSYQLTVEAL